MPVSTRQPSFAARLEAWTRCRDAVAGSDAVKAAAETYLPRLGGQGLVNVVSPGIGAWQIDEYESYKKRANWFNASEAAVKEVVGALFRVAPVFDVPSELDIHLRDITLTGESAEIFCQRLAMEITTVSFAGVLVDLPREASTPRPYWTLYQAEQILRVRLMPFDGVWMIGQVVLAESSQEPSSRDEFEDEAVTRYRVLQLDESGFLIHRPFLVIDGRAVEQETILPMVRGQRIPVIPFVPFTPNSLQPDPPVPVLLNLVDINLSHYRTSADLEEALHKLAVPTPYASGVDDVGMEMRLGANIFYACTNPGFKMAYAEFSGAGLGELRTALEHKEAQMDAIRSRLMSQQKGGVESAEAIRLRTSGEQNVLMAAAHTLSEGLTRLLGYHATLVGLRGAAVSAKINDDFIDNTLAPQEVAELRATVQAGLMSYETFFWNLSKGELFPPDRSADEEKALIDAEAPLGGEPALEIPETREPDETDAEVA